MNFIFFYRIKTYIIMRIFNDFHIHVIGYIFDIFYSINFIFWIKELMFSL